MRIKVEPGVVVRLDRRRSTSRLGGEYDISDLSAPDRKRVLEAQGVSVVGPQKVNKPAPKAEAK